MPSQQQYTVTFPDGRSQSFIAPEGLSDTEAYLRGLQERDVATGKMQTGFWGGFTKQLGQERGTTGSLISGVGYLTGQPEIVAAAPLAARGIEYVTRKLTGEQPDLPSASELAVDAGTGLAQAYGPAALAKSGSAIADALSRAPVSPSSGGVGNLGAWALRESAPAVDAATGQAGALGPAATGQTVQDLIGTLRDAATRARGGVTADEVELLTNHIKQGMNPQTALRIVGENDPDKMAALRTLYLRGRLAASIARAKP